MTSELGVQLSARGRQAATTHLMIIYRWSSFKKKDQVVISLATFVIELSWGTYSLRTLPREVNLLV